MLTGIILAGGRNSRMQGHNKAFLRIEGEWFIERQMKVMRTICEQLIVVTNDPNAYSHLIKNDTTCVSDIYTGHGPLSGFHAAFSNVNTEYAWVVGCDYPLLSATAAKWMLSQLITSDDDAVIPVIGGRHQMLHGVYRPARLLPLITQKLDSQQYRLSGLLDEISWLGLDEKDWKSANIDPQFSVDVDTKEQYTALINETERRK